MLVSKILGWSIDHPDHPLTRPLPTMILHCFLLLFLGKMRMTTPCRSSTCDHLQCFDASLYLMMNEKKPKWVCPVCNKAGKILFTFL